MSKEEHINAFQINDFGNSVDERKALALAEVKMDELEAKYPDWWILFDDTSPDMAPRAEVVELMASAPNPFALGLLYGKYTMRLEIAAMTKREWN